MKGEKIVTNLIPYGPEKPRYGMVKKGEHNPGTNEVEIFWDPPRGEFTKYFLNIEKVSDKQFTAEEIADGDYMRSVLSESKPIVLLALLHSHHLSCKASYHVSCISLSIPL